MTRLLLSPHGERPTAKQALRHEWMKERNNTTDSSPLRETIPADMMHMCELSGWMDKQQSSSPVMSAAEDSPTSSERSVPSRTRSINKSPIVRTVEPGLSFGAARNGGTGGGNTSRSPASSVTATPTLEPSAQLLWLQKMEDANEVDSSSPTTMRARAGIVGGKGE